MKIQLPLLLVLATSLSAVPSDINYQGRLTDANGDAVTGNVSMSVKMYDAQSGGNEIYSEDIGTVTLDENGVYSFQFGASGNSTVTKTETIVTSDGSSTEYTGTFTSTPIDGTISVTDETYSWNDVDGNPGEQATAYIIIINGFVIFADVENGGSGYDDDNPPLVTITGDGNGATATATVDNGVITGITIDVPGTQYTEGDITIAPPPAPFTVDKVDGNLEVEYAVSPAVRTGVVATYKTLEPSIIGALSEASSHWLELTVDGAPQNPRERILSVPFAQVAGETVEKDYNFSNYLIRENDKIYNESFPGFILVQPKYGKGVSGDVKIGLDANALVKVSSYSSSLDIQMPSVQSRPTSSIIPLPNGFYWRASGYDSVMFIPIGSQDLSSYQEQFLFPTDTNNFETQDNDGDGISNNADPDDDNDGLLDVVETNTGIWVDVSNTGTDPNNADSDGDGLSDLQELNFFSSPYEIVYGSYTYSEALQDAVIKGGYVARTRNIDEFAKLNRYLNTQLLDDIGSYSINRDGVPSGAHRLWFSANYSDADNRWEWHPRPPSPLHNGEEPGHTLIWDLGYDEWLDVGNQTAVMLEHLKDDQVLPFGVSKSEFPYDWYWDSQFENEKYCYILERDVERLIIEGKNSDPNNAESDGDGVSSSNFLLIDGSYTWEEARLDAESRGGQLAVLNTQDKINTANVYLQGQSYSSYGVYIGLSDHQNEGSWKWVNETDLSTANWASGEPNNYNHYGGEHFVIIDKSDWKWNDVIADGRFPYLLETYNGDIEEGLVSYYDFSSLSATQGSGNNILLYNDAEIYNDLERGSVLRIVTNSTQAGIYGNISQAPGGYALLNGALDDISNNGNNDFSLSLWLKLENTQVHPGGSIINLGDNNSVYERPIIGYVNRLNGQDNSNTEAPLYLQTPGNEDWNILANLSDILNVWQHYVITVTDNILRLYLNGEEIESYPGGNLWDSVNTVGEKLYFGAEIWTGSGGDRGSTRITARFDDLKVYNKQLTSNEIIQLASL